MANFSGAVRIGDVSDFIAPSQACVVNVADRQVLQENVGFKQTTLDAGSNAVKVSLQDCLACSGCVTSAETILLQQQSTDELLKSLQDPNITVIATISPQSRASIAAEHGLGVQKAGRHLVGFLKSLGVAFVLDAHVARGVSLLEAAAELESRIRRHWADHSAPPAAAPRPGPQPSPLPAQPSGEHRVDGDTHAPRAPAARVTQPVDGSSDALSCSHAAPLRPAVRDAADRSCKEGVGHHAADRSGQESRQTPAAPRSLRLDDRGLAERGGLAPPSCTSATLLTAPAHRGEGLADVDNGVEARVLGPSTAAINSASEWTGLPAGLLHGDDVRARPSSPSSQVKKARSGDQGHLLGSARGADASEALPGPLPMLASACPGWICYAEKTHGDVLPHVSTAKSPQAVAGSLLKRHFCAQRGLDPARVYHVAVMPCFDKKLEASRDDFRLAGPDGAPGGGPAEVDCVITTLELHELLRQRGVALGDCAVGSMDAFLPGAARDETDRLYGVRGGSGGYCEFVLKSVARSLFGVELGDAPLEFKPLRNADFREVAVEAGGRVVLRGAIANGFRNIQGLMRRLKQRRCEYDFVEVMACPAGCLNGGGQVKVAGGQAQVHERLALLEALYHDRNDVIFRWPHEDPQVSAIYSATGAGVPFSSASREFFHTQYHARAKSVTSSLLDW